MANEESKNYQFFSTAKSALEAMYNEIGGAKESIYWETYIFEDDAVGRHFVDLLCEKAQAGIEVKLILDGFGSFWIADRDIERLEKAGAEVLYFNPLKLSSFWRGAWRLFERNHRKTLIVDKRVGFIGGVNVMGGSSDWFDLHVRMEGPIVSQLLRNFSRSYLAGGGVFDRVKHLIYIPLTKEKYRKIFWHQPREKFSSVRNVYFNAVRRAKKSLTLVSPYFIPDKEFLDALAEARRRGVKINLILPKKTDLSTLTYAARTYWSLYHNLGIRIYLVKKMIHAKAMMVDDKWAMVGSSNFDSQTFYRSHESNLIFTSRQMIEDLKAIFKSWRRESKIFHPAIWSRRSIFHRVWEFFGRLLRPYL